ncbi:MAG: hypothetical protein JO250_23260 [Armatimonadetes bacterium]|nr:hypothetical protein [Armatimonadota bacterium]
MRPFLLALAAGALFAVSLPPMNWEWAGWIALAPLLTAAVGRRPLESLGLGLLGGLFCGVLRAGWNRDTERLFWAYLPFLWLTLLFGGVALAAAWARRRAAGLPWVLFVTCLAVAGEWLTTWLPLPLNVALCQHRNLALIQIASVTGIWGISFLVWLVNAAIADATLQRGLWTKPLAIAAGLALLSWGYGMMTDPYANGLTTLPNIQQLPVAAIQDFTGDETGDLVQHASDGATDVDRDQMTRQAAKQGARLIVWSEECLGSAFRPDDPDDPTRALARKLHTSLVVGYSDDSRPRPFNCAAFIGPDGVVRGVHHKIHLYLGESRSVQRGGTPTAYRTALGRVGMEVCFDSCYTGVTRQIVRSGAQLIAMPNYDPPSPQGVLHELHGAMLPFRAVENQVPFVRADSNGRSQIIGADGRIVAQAALYAPNVLMGTVALGDGRGTFFTRCGDWLAYLCVIGAGIYGILFRNRAVSGRQRALRGAADTRPQSRPVPVD